MDDATLIARLREPIDGWSYDVPLIDAELAAQAAARIEALTAERDAAVAAERERCARVAEGWEDGFPHDNGEWGDALEYAAEKIAAAIRGEG